MNSLYSIEPIPSKYKADTKTEPSQVSRYIDYSKWPQNYNSSLKLKPPGILDIKNPSEIQTQCYCC